MITRGPSNLSLLLGIELDSLAFESRLSKATDLVLKWFSEPSGKTETFMFDWPFVTVAAK